MNEEERENIVQQLLDEFVKSLGYVPNDDTRFGFIAGARSGIYEITIQRRADKTID